MRECKSLFNEYQSLAPMYTFEFWLETLSKSIPPSAPSATPYRGDSLGEDDHHNVCPSLPHDPSLDRSTEESARGRPLPKESILQSIRGGAVDGHDG